MRRTRSVGLLGGCALIVLAGQAARTQPSASQPGADWPMYRHDYAGTGYSPLAQISTKNVASLREVWSYRVAGDNANSQATPIVVNGVMYLPAANRVVALDPETGTESGGSRRRRRRAVSPRRRVLAGRRRRPPRIIFMAGRRLSRSTRPGRPCHGIRHERRSRRRRAVQLGAARLPERRASSARTTRRASGGAIGNARAFDARTGAKLWEFSSVAQPGSPGHDTWEGDSWKGRLGANAWPFYFTLDEQRGIALPAAGIADSRRLRRRSGRRQPVTATPWSPSTCRPARTSGTFKPSTTICGMPIRPRRPVCFDIVRNGRTRAGAGADDQVGLSVHPESRDRPADLRRRGTPGSSERRAGRTRISDSADSREAAAARACRVRARGSRHARRIRRRSTQRRAGNWSRRTAASTTRDRSRRGGIARRERPRRCLLVFPGGLGGANWGRHGVRIPASGYVFVATQDVGALGWVRKAREGAAVAVREGHTRTRQLRCSDGG